MDRFPDDFNRANLLSRVADERARVAECCRSIREPIYDAVVDAATKQLLLDMILIHIDCDFYRMPRVRILMSRSVEELERAAAKTDPEPGSVGLDARRVENAALLRVKLELSARFADPTCPTPPVSFISRRNPSLGFIRKNLADVAPDDFVLIRFS